MKQVLLLLACGTIAISTLFGQEIKKCDVFVVLATKNKAGQLTQKDVTDFLMTFSKECQNNAEFSEFSNEVLFLIFDKQTDLVLKTIVKTESKLEIDKILVELSSPINDMINVKDLLTKVDQVKIESGLKKKIIDNLKIAYENSY